jgi:NitT/TauT family transport system ATP-binding protein
VVRQSGHAAGIAVDRLSKTFNRADNIVHALSDISFAVEPGKFVSVVGPSGCGKSTMLQIVAGLLPASQGEVRIEGELITRPKPERVGLVFQEPWLLPWKTVIENVEFPLFLAGVSKAERRDRACVQLELVGLAHAERQYPHELSGGMKQRVAIARSLVQTPAILLMDEPFGALDEQTRTRMGAELLNIWERSRRTILFVTHGLSEAIYLSDVVFVMAARPGRIVERLEVPLPRPRTINMMGRESFGLMRNRIWDLISDRPA